VVLFPRTTVNREAASTQSGIGNPVTYQEITVKADIDSARSGSPSPTTRATVFVGRWPDVPVVAVPGIPAGTFSPTTSVLISGPTEVVLIDAQYLTDDVADFGDLIERTGKTLTTIYITHAHADHYGGLGTLLECFPNAKGVALPQVVEAITETLEACRRRWRR
jgi:glyoxylase-like metal-dependent hydrolase (beta-lactamase superfamily II)